MLTLLAQQADQAEAIAALRAELGVFCGDQRQQNSDLARAIWLLAEAIAAQRSPGVLSGPTGPRMG